MNLLSRITGPSTVDERRYDLSWLINAASGRLADASLVTTWQPSNGERIGNNWAAYVEQGYKANGVVFACVLARMLVFSEARFMFRRLRNGRPGDLFGTRELRPLDVPWTNGTTGELLARMEQDVSLAGNAFVWKRRGSDTLRRLRPDRVTVLLGSRTAAPEMVDLGAALDAEIAGYLYDPGPGGTPQLLPPEEVAHWSPIPDPNAAWRGMSWLTPVVTEIDADGSMNTHRQRFFDNAATPNLAIKFDPSVTQDQIRVFKDLLEEGHAGATNAWKTMYLGGGADPVTIGQSFEQMNFKAVQGAGETRIAAAAAVPPVIVGLSEGLAASTYSNYGQARRKFADGWARPMWRSVSAALAQLVNVPADAELWYDASDIPFLQEDEKDAADIRSVDAQAIRTLVEAGFEPDAVIAAVNSDDMGLLAGAHTGLWSVQLQPPVPAGSLP